MGLCLGVPVRVGVSKKVCYRFAYVDLLSLLNRFYSGFWFWSYWSLRPTLFNVSRIDFKRVLGWLVCGCMG